MAAPDLAEHVRLLRDFANSLDVEEHTDALGTAAELTGWLRDRALLPSEPESIEVRATEMEATEQDLALAVDLRTALRQAMADHECGRRRALPELDEVAARLPLRVEYADGYPRLRPLADGVRGALTAIVAALADAYADGSWRRLKLCGADDCRWAFYDTSKNRSRQWCSMGVCGNRNKTRAWRARQRAADHA